MSYQGYEQALCSEGHYNHIDAYFFGMVLCDYPGCTAELIWFNGVDQTNGCTNKKGYLLEGNDIHSEIFCHSCGMAVQFKNHIHTPAETETCPTCDHTKQIKPATYKFPSNAGRWSNNKWKTKMMQEGRTFKVDKTKYPHVR